MGLDLPEAVFQLTEAVLPEVCDAFQDDTGAAIGPQPDLHQAVEERLVGLLDLLRREKIVDFGALRGQAKTRFKEGFIQAVARTCERLVP